MKLHVVDILIICAYLIVIVLIGLFLKKKAAKNMDSYFLGGKSLPFYMLGLSNASGMFDITGTMLMVYWAFAYGFCAFSAGVFVLSIGILMILLSS